MGQITVNGATLYYEVSGEGAETIVFSHGLLLNCRQFDGQVAALRDRYRCISFDFRGQGQSEVTRGGYDLDNLTEDTAALIGALGCAPCHFVGLSMGGMVGMRLAVRHPALVRSLVLMATSASTEGSAWRFRLMSWAGRLFGVRALTPWVMPLQFGRTFLRDPARAEERRTWFARIAANSRNGAIRAAGGVIGRAGFSDLGEISVPALVLAGAEDTAIPPAEARRLQEGIAGAELVSLPGVGHAMTIEAPAAVSGMIAEFLGRQR